MSDRHTWLQNRHNGIGSSDAACLHEKSPYKTRYELWEEKISPTYREETTNFAMQKGVDLEPIARLKFAAIYNLVNNTDETFEAKNIEMLELPFMRASLDGASKDLKTIIEIKYQGKENHARAHEFIPVHYMIQMQHQLLVSGADKAFFVSFDGETIKFQEVLPDIDFMRTHLKACSDFWELVRTKKAPPLSAQDYKELKTKGAKEIAQNLKELLASKDEIETKISELREQLFSMVTHPRMICNGLKILQCPGNKGSVDYPRLLKDLGIECNVEEFRKPDGKPYFKIC